MTSKPVYITSPIYYVNDVPHLGTAYCTIAADVFARYHRLLGKDVRFLTGTDEHGEKIEEAATKKGKSPQAYTDEIAEIFESTWKKLGISFDDFIRTTEDRHKKVVCHLIKKALKQGDIYLGEYEGWYCVSDETFWTETQLVNGKCPDCGKDVKKIKEENYFFKLAKFVPALVEHINKNPDFILPESKRNEVLAFLSQEEIRPISVSRTSFTWGIPFPLDAPSKHIVYVWYDALVNYISALEPELTPDGLAGKNYEKYWGTLKDPHAVHLIGKDILRFHAVYWPCFLLALGLPLPKRIFAHGWWTIEGQKMSKSKGNTVDPIAFTAQYGNDAFRLFLFREFPIGQDGDFSLKNFKERVNADLANNLGNLVSRTLTLVGKFMESKTSKAASLISDDPLKKGIEEALTLMQKAYLGENMERFDFHTVLNNIFAFVSSLNKFIDNKAPWSLAKDPAKMNEVRDVLNTVAEGLRISAIVLAPFTPETSNETLRRLGQKPLEHWREVGLSNALTWGQGEDATTQVGPPLFMRLQ